MGRIRVSLRIVQCVACVGLLAPLAAGAALRSHQQPAAAESAATRSGAALVSAAGAALGTDRARAAAAGLQAEQSGSYHAQEQARSPAQPSVAAGRSYRWQFDAAAQRLIREASLLYPGGIRFATRTALEPSGGWQIDLIRWRTGTDIDAAAADESLRTRLQWERFFPHLLIRQAQAARQVTASGLNAFTFTDAAGASIQVMLDPATSRPVRALQAEEGRPQIELAYSDYERRHGILMPARLQLHVGGRLLEDVRLGRTALGRPPAAAFRPPAGYALPPAAGEPSARALAEGVFFFENMPGDYHALAVDMGDHLLLVEAPLNPAHAAAQQRVLQQLRPGKAVRHVLVTHHHGDHIGGLQAWAEAGATIVVAAGARIAIERQLRARGYQGALRIEEVANRRTFGAGATQVDAHALATSHAEANLLVHLPQPRILFQGDLFYLPARGGPPPAFPVVGELARQIAARGLGVDLIVGVHGRPATPADMQQSLRLGRR